jgi:hypothetical protein
MFVIREHLANNKLRLDEYKVEIEIRFYPHVR